MLTKKSLLIFLILLPMVLSGCTFLGLNSIDKNDLGGVFKSVDFGERWQNSNAVKQPGKRAGSINAVNTTVIKIDPLNSQNIYVGTAGHGVWYSDSGGANWRRIFDQGSVVDMALDPKNSGVVFITLGKQMFKTLDLGDKWDPLYIEERRSIEVTSLAVDWEDNLALYAGTSNGEIYKSFDGGESWQLIFDQENKSRSYTSIVKILINPKDVNKVYVATAKKGIFKSSDKGKTWENLFEYYGKRDVIYEEGKSVYTINIWGKKQLVTTADKSKKVIIKGTEYFRDMVFDLTQKDALLLATNYGIFKTNDGGQTWSDIKLLTPENTVIIRALAMNPQNNTQIYYATDTALYRTFDSGQTWLTSKLPSSRSGNEIVVDSYTPNIVYLGLRNQEVEK